MSEFVEVKTADLIDAALDRAVEMALGGVRVGHRLDLPCGYWCVGLYQPSTDWSQGGPLIESEELTVEPSAWDWKGTCVLWRATEEGESVYFEHTNLLVAAMRAVVHAKLGDTVSVPKELMV
jgi:hypothetical protein